MQKPLPVAAGQPGEVDVPPSEGHEVADCGHCIVRKSLMGIKSEYEIVRTRRKREGRGREVLTESTEEGASVDNLASKADVDPEKASSQCSMYLGTLRCEVQHA